MPTDCSAGPSAAAPIAMGYLPTVNGADGTIVFAELRGQRMPMRVSPMPFVPHSYQR